MNFRVQNIKPGYCEIWANTSHGARYQRLAVVMRDKSSNGKGESWHWSAKHDEPPFFMPSRTGEFCTRYECIIDCERLALKSLVERAIREQPQESEHWHSPRRDALSEVVASHFFTPDEVAAISHRLNTFTKTEETTSIRKTLERENYELQDENARLRSCLSDDKENAELILGENKDLIDENERLRRLVKDMVFVFRMPLEDHRDEVDWLDKAMMEVHGKGLYQSMEELGIES